MSKRDPVVLFVHLRLKRSRSLQASNKGSWKIRTMKSMKTSYPCALWWKSRGVDYMEAEATTLGEWQWKVKGERPPDAWVPASQLGSAVLLLITAPHYSPHYSSSLHLLITLLITAHHYSHHYRSSLPHLITSHYRSSLLLLITAPHYRVHVRHLDGFIVKPCLKFSSNFIFCFIRVLGDITYTDL